MESKQKIVLKAQLAIILLLVGIAVLFLIYRARKFDKVYPDPLSFDLDQRLINEG